MRALFLALTLAALPACYKVNEPPCSYACSAATGGLCPENYVCASDGYCHRSDYTGECTFGGVGDMSVDNETPDLPLVDISPAD